MRHRRSFIPSLQSGMRLVAVSCGLAALPVASAFAQFPLQLQGKVIHVDDGDTLILLDPSMQKHTIRLTDLDAPESPKPRFKEPGQPFSKASGKHLTMLAKGRPAQATCYEADRYRRLVCRVVVDGIDLSLAQIASGFGWANGANKRYVRDPRAYQYEQQARQARKGLWADAAPIEPWKWRTLCWKQQQCAGAGE